MGKYDSVSSQFKSWRCGYENQTEELTYVEQSETSHKECPKGHEATQVNSVQSMIMETWLSGRKRLTANEVGCKSPRGFESLRLRNRDRAGYILVRIGVVGGFPGGCLAHFPIFCASINNYLIE